MKRFENAQVGDEVYSRLYGFGKIVDINIAEDLYCYDVLVAFSCTRKQFGFDLNGRRKTTEIEPTLFYVDGDNKYCETRPEPPKPILKASQVPMDTKVFIEKYRDKRHFKSSDKLCYWVAGRTSFTCSMSSTKW